MFHRMTRWALSGRLQTRRILACSILLALLACAGLPSVSDASRKFRGKGFVTIVPSNWKVGKSRQGPARLYGAASPTTKTNVAANTMQLGVSVLPVVDMERQLGGKLPSSLQDLLGIVLEQQGQNAQIAAPLRSSTLGGRPAASGAIQYPVDGTRMLQSATISIYRGQVYFVSFNIDVAVQYKGLPTLARVHRHWHWR